MTSVFAKHSAGFSILSRLEFINSVLVISYDSCNTFSLFLRNFQAWVTISISVHSYQFIRLLLRTNLPNLVIKNKTTSAALSFLRFRDARYCSDKGDYALSAVSVCLWIRCLRKLWTDSYQIFWVDKATRIRTPLHPGREGAGVNFGPTLVRCNLTRSDQI